MSETSEGVEGQVEHDDVLEALKWFRRKAERVPVGGVPMPDRLIEEREQVVTRYLSQKEETIRDLRERLEEAREERDRWEDEAGHNLSTIRELRAELEGTCVGCGGEADEGLFCDGCSGGLDALERAFSDCDWEVTYNDPEGGGGE